MGRENSPKHLMEKNEKNVLKHHNYTLGFQSYLLRFGVLGMFLGPRDNDLGFLI